MTRIVLIFSLICITSFAFARESDNPCPDCCAQLQRIVVEVEKAPVRHPLLANDDSRKEIAGAIVASTPGDPVAEVHCAHLVKKFKDAAEAR